MTQAQADVPTGNTFDKYSSSNPIERRMMSSFFAALDRFVDDASPRRAIEVGAGEGLVTRRLLDRRPGLSMAILDLPDPELSANWDHVDASGVHGSIERLPFPDACADLVLAIEVLEHVPDPDAAVAEIARVTASHAVLSVPREPIWRLGNVARGRYVRDLGNTPGHIQHWSRRSFVRMVSRHLDVLEVAAPLPWTVVHARRRSRPSRRPPGGDG